MSTESFEKLWLLVLINNFSGVTGYKIYLQKSIVFLYISNEQYKSKISKAIRFTITLKRIKYLDKCNQSSSYLGTEVYKTWLKEMKDHLVNKMAFMSMDQKT